LSGYVIALGFAPFGGTTAALAGCAAMLVQSIVLPK
jgi:uncharacterized OsmC-like protein